MGGLNPAAALAPPEGWTPPQAASPTPMDVNPATMGGAPQLPAPTMPDVSQQQPQTTPASQDPEMVAGHAHQSWLGHIMDVVGGILGGDQTIHVTKSPDGTMTVSHDPSTSGEKWSRVAQAALVGAAQGLAHGQGPGGTAQAIAAGTAAGAALPQQQLNAANQEATAANKILMTKAQHAMLDQQIAMQQLQMKELPAEYQRQKEAFALDQTLRLREAGAVHAANTKNPQEMAQFGNADPLSRAAHTGASDDVMQPVANPDGSIDWWRIPADKAKQLTTDDSPWTEMQHDPKDFGNVIQVPHMSKAGSETYGARALREKGLSASNETVQKDAAEYRNKQREGIPKTGAEATIQSLIPGTPAPLAAAYSQAGKQIYQQEINKAAAGRAPAAGGGLTPGAAGASTAGVTGDEYLKAAVDPSMWNQVKSIANGDMKMPTAGMKGANQALRNAVMNYDPTYTDARYTGKQQFKTGTEAAKLNQLSTGLEHLESAISHADYNPLLPYSDKATAYAEDIKHFTQESGKYIKSGALTQGEYNDLMEKANSVIPSVRESALREKAGLLGGKVRASFQQYKAATGQDLPVHEFFDPDTQTRLTRYALTPPAAGAGGPGAGGPPPPPTGNVTVQIPGLPSGTIPRSQLKQFQHDHPNAKVF